MFRNAEAYPAQEGKKGKREKVKKGKGREGNLKPNLEDKTYAYIGYLEKIYCTNKI